MQEKIYEVSPEWSRRAYLDEAGYRAKYAASLKDPEAFWAEEAKRIHWFREPTRIKNTNFGPENVSIRWFEDYCTVSPDWPDECYINHSHAPSGLWHLGFVFAAADLEAGAEVTFDYGHIIAPGYTLPWCDSVSGRPITGYDWADSLQRSLAALTAITGRTVRSKAG